MGSKYEVYVRSHTHTHTHTHTHVRSNTHTHTHTKRQGTRERTKTQCHHTHTYALRLNVQLQQMPLLPVMHRPDLQLISTLFFLIFIYEGPSNNDSFWFVFSFILIHQNSIGSLFSHQQQNTMHILNNYLKGKKKKKEIKKQHEYYSKQCLVYT